MKAIYERIRARLRNTFGAKEPPSRVAAALALGITISFSPFQGLHTVIALLLAFVLRLNKPDVLLGTVIVNPWTLPVYFPAACWLGSRLTGIPVPHFALPSPGELLHRLASPTLEPWVRDVLVIWGVGASLCTLAVGPTSFWLLRHFIERHRAKHPHPPDQLVS
ncbi:MAG TPA: DUF2062 domain-containing protein [Thermoanaerobaculaceae bacterium]|nr:DUF2062 domain-containing protein [Thermoanaerobaculaceae bacterium]HPS78437.1 DUF2062 domain-containing protein [Thermoanaerobaculaceae bacterium]